VLLFVSGSIYRQYTARVGGASRQAAGVGSGEHIVGTHLPLPSREVRGAKRTLQTQALNSVI